MVQLFSVAGWAACSGTAAALSVTGAVPAVFLLSVSVSAAVSFPSLASAAGLAAVWDFASC